MRLSGRARTRHVCCVVCGAFEGIEMHHVCGRNHVPWFTVPLCQPHHHHVTRLLREAGVDMRRARTKNERISQAFKAIAVLQFWLSQELLTP
jgi:hypothetical protein